MKFLSFARVIAFTMLLTGAAVLNVSAQTNTNSSNGNSATPTRTVERTTTVRDNDTDWGWLGILGLAGLAGLIPKKRAVEVHDNRTVRDDRTTDRTTNM
jgi:hypothetical protein